MKIGDRVQVIETADPSNPIDPVLIGAHGIIVSLGDGLTVEGMVRVQHERSGTIDAYWPEELEII